MGKTANHDEDLPPTDLVMARLVFQSNVARTKASLSSSFCLIRIFLMLLQTFDGVIGCGKLFTAFDGIYDVMMCQLWMKATLAVSIGLQAPNLPFVQEV